MYSLFEMTLFRFSYFLSCLFLYKFYSATASFPKIKEYYESNWANCLPMWARAYKHGCLAYMNDTNNPVETVNNVLKQFVPKTTTTKKTSLIILSLSATRCPTRTTWQCKLKLIQLRIFLSLNNLLFYLQSLLVPKLVPTRIQGLDKDAVVNEIHDCSTQYAPSIMLAQYLLSKSSNYKI